MTGGGTDYPSLRDRVVLVTGGTRGLGLEMALELASAGCHVAITGSRASQALDEARAALEAAAGGPGRTLALVADAADFAACEQAVAETIAAFGRIDVVINNAGIGMRLISETFNTEPVKFWQIEPEHWAAIMATNVNGAFNMARAAVPSMIAQGFGKVINISTSDQTMVRKGYAPYGPSKAALEAASRVWAQDLAGTGVDVNVYLPGGAADTGLLPDGPGKKGADGNLLPPAIMRRAIRWLCDDASNGQTGGRYIARLWDEALEPDEAAAGARSPGIANPRSCEAGTMLTLGQATIRTIADLDPFRLPLPFLFPDGDLSAIEGERALLEPDHVDFASGDILLGVQSHLLQMGGLNILIDTCVGEDKERPRRPDWHRRTGTGYLDRLADAGLRPDDVDVVLCTHLHADHAGWNTRLHNGRWVPTFPKARYLMGRAEHAHWSALESSEPGQHNHGLYADSVAPVIESGLAELVDDGFSLSNGLDVKALPGHSPGQIGLCLCHGHAGRRLLFCGDAVHSPVQVFQPGWASRFCFDPAQAVSTRKALLEEAADDGMLLVPAHLRGHTAMAVKRMAGRLRPDFL